MHDLDAQRTKLTGAERTARSAAGEASGLSEMLGAATRIAKRQGTDSNDCEQWSD
jgi:hypothetical protein